MVLRLTRLIAGELIAQIIGLVDWHEVYEYFFPDHHDLL
jgi:hypothetical protein